MDAIKPAEAVRASISGIVVLEIAIDDEGTVTSARVLRSIPLLDRAALDAVRRWRFEPPAAQGSTACCTDRDRAFPLKILRSQIAD